MLFLLVSIITTTLSFASPPPALQPWLDAHPQVANALKWTDGGAVQSYPQWTADKKQALGSTFEKLWQWHQSGAVQDNPLGLAVTPENIAPWSGNPNSPGQWAVFISRKDAWNIYISHVAQSLVYEFRNGKLAPLENMSELGLRILFDGTRMFYPSQKGQVFRFSTNLTGTVVPAPATLEFSFLKRNGLLGASPTETIHKLMEWSRQNLEHFSGDTSYANAQSIWQYPGFPPVSKIIDGTISAADPQKKRTHYTAGCSGTVGFFISILRTVNIPVELKEVCLTQSHAAALFVEQGLYLSHGDNPYNQFSRKQPRIPIQKLLFHHQQWATWFEGDGQKACEQVGKTPEQAFHSLH